MTGAVRALLVVVCIVVIGYTLFHRGYWRQDEHFTMVSKQKMAWIYDKQKQDNAVSNDQATTSTIAPRTSSAPPARFLATPDGSPIETPLELPVEDALYDLENKKCKHLTDHASGIDVLQRYRFIEHPTDPDACYFKMNDTLVSNQCSATNSNLYDPSFADVVSGVKTELMNDPYSAKTLLNNQCVITFDANATNDRKYQYATFIDSHDPKTEALMGQETTEKSNIDSLNQQIAQLGTQVKSVQDQIANETNVRADLQKQVADNEKAIADQVAAKQFALDTLQIVTDELKSFTDAPMDDGTTGIASAETSGQCRGVRTDWQRIYEDWWTLELGKLNAACAPDEYISRLNMETQYDPSYARYDYTCCKLNPNITNAKPQVTSNTTAWNDAGKNWDLPFLDRHPIDCGEDKLLNQVQAATKKSPSNLIQFGYSCLQPNYPAEDRPTTVCADYSTAPMAAAPGFNHLDKQVIDCPDGQGLSALQFVNDIPNNAMYYNYKCCTTLVDRPS